MKMSMMDLERIEKLLFYRCLCVVGSLLIFATTTPFFIKKIVPWFEGLLPSQTFATVMASVLVILLALSGYLVFHFFFLRKKIKGLAHFAELGLASAQVAHDVRAPLSVFKCILPILGKSIKIENDDVEQMLRVLGQAHLRMDGICEDLLAKQSGESEPLRGFRLHKILDELIDEVKANRSLSDVNFKRNYDEKLVFFLGRQNRLQRVFANIIKNAVEAMKFNGEIVVSTIVKNNGVVVSIQDNGPGMSHELVNRILTTGATKGKVKGNGLGMQFVREVIQNHKGKLFIDSVEGKGTTISIALPLAQSGIADIVVAKPVAEQSSVEDNNSAVVVS